MSQTVPAPELRTAVLALYAALGRPDAAWVSSHVLQSDTTTVIGSADDEWWTGYDAVSTGWAAVKATYGGTRLTPTRLTCHEHDGWGWAVDEPSYELEHGTTGSFRITMLFVAVPGSWRLVHLHVSVDAPNEQL